MTQQQFVFLPMWFRLLTFLLLVSLAGCTSQSTMRQEESVVGGVVASAKQARELDEAQRYFLEIALRSEYGNADPLVRRWERPVRLFMDGDKPAALVQEAYAVIDEMKSLVPHLDIQWVTDPDDANVQIFFGPYKQYSSKYAPKSRKYLRRNWGFFTVRWHASSSGIESASMYVDTHRARDDDQRKHLLREELTQLFGLMADSKRYPDSIFYQHWSTTTQYSELDRALIKMLYDKQIHSGMDEQALRAVWADTAPKGARQGGELSANPALSLEN